MGFATSYDYLVFDMTVPQIPSPGSAEWWIKDALPAIGIRSLSFARHEFKSPIQGTHAYTLLAVLSASHMAVHTAPEHSWVQVTFALCDGEDRSQSLENLVRAFFQPLSLKISRFRCGVEEKS